MIKGDLNAKIGKESSFRPTIGPNRLHSISNVNGTRLVNFSCSKKLIKSSIFFLWKDTQVHVEVPWW